MSDTCISISYSRPFLSFTQISRIEIEELILSKNTLENNVIKLEKIEKICDELFENELAGNGKTWQQEGIDILLTKLGIDRINNFC